MIDPVYVQRMARYNRWQNENLYGAASTLTDAQRKEQRGAFFGSIHGTLNHILLGDRLWLTRFAGGTAPSTGLDAILYEDFAELAAARAAEDARIETFFADLAEPFLAGR